MCVTLGLIISCLRLKFVGRVFEEPFEGLAIEIGRCNESCVIFS